MAAKLGGFTKILVGALRWPGHLFGALAFGPVGTAILQPGRNVRRYFSKVKPRRC
jgi:hypothetical protein